MDRTFAHRHLYYYSTIRLILIYRPSEGGRLSRPRHCSQCEAVSKAAYRSDFRENTNFCPQRDSNLGPLAQQASVLPLDHCDLRHSYGRAIVWTAARAADLVRLVNLDNERQRDVVCVGELVWQGGGQFVAGDGEVASRGYGSPHHRRHVGDEAVQIERIHVGGRVLRRQSEDQPRHEVGELVQRTDGEVVAGRPVTGKSNFYQLRQPWLRPHHNERDMHIANTQLIWKIPKFLFLRCLFWKIFDVKRDAVLSRFSRLVQFLSRFPDLKEIVKCDSSMINQMWCSAPCRSLLINPLLGACRGSQMHQNSPNRMRNFTSCPVFEYQKYGHLVYTFQSTIQSVTL